MELSVKEAATLIGKSPRTVRHLVRTGQLPARREGRAWRIDRDTLLAYDPAGRAAQREQVLHLREHVEDALDAITPTADPAPARDFYSVRDLHAFRIATAILTDLPARPETTAVRDALRATLRALSEGCHRFRPPDKRAAYRDARAHASVAIAELVAAHAST
ncbi:MAG: helix-turn-helix domain-containing protein [Deltaproteobacteria bacterium]